MFRQNKGKIQKPGLLTAIFSGLMIGLPTIPLVAQTTPIGAKPCARIFYEEPYDGYVIVPQECPPNTATQQAIEEGRLPARQSNTSTQTTQPSQPENRSNVVATVTPTDGTVNVRVKNNTNALVQYQAIGSTDYVSIKGGEETVLRNIPLPTTITFARQDDGFVRVMPMSGTTEGTLEVTLNEDAQPLDSTQGTLSIQEDGSVLLN
jgi:hypothetical protein